MKKCVFSILILLFGQQVCAWGPMGHRIIAEVAYQYLNKKTIKEVDAVLGKHGMVYWSTWPDEIKSDRTIYPTSYDWHFQDLPSGLTAADIDSFMTNYPQQGGRLWSTLEQLYGGLTGQDTILLINEEQVCRHDALVFYIHLMGDFFCPMHMAHEEDKGGNTVSMNWFDRKTNLHSVWDEALISSRGMSYTEFAQMLIDTYGKDAPAIQQRNKASLAQEVYRVTQAVYAYQDKGDKNTYHYMWAWKEPCDQLLFMAGVQLGQALNNIGNFYK